MSGRLDEPWSLVDLFELGEAAMSLFAAHQVGLVDALGEGPRTPDELAAALDLDPRAVRLVLNVLLAYGAVTATNGHFQTSDALAGAVAASPGGGSLDLLLYGHIPAFLRHGQPAIAMDGTAQERGEHYATVAPGLYAGYRRVAAELASALPADLLDVLDLGAGSGVWSLALLDRDPRTRLTAVDLPPVAALLRGSVAEAGLAARVEVHDGSYLDIDLPERAYDCVILGNVLHLEPPEGAEHLVRRAAAALRPRGTLLVIDILGEPGYETRRIRAMYALFLALRTRHGRVHGRAEVTGWLTGAGLVDVRPVTLSRQPSLLDFLLATYPDSPDNIREVTR